MEIIFGDIQLNKKLGLKVKRSNHLDTFERQMEIIEIQGGDPVVIDYGGKKPKDVEIVCNLDGRGLPKTTLRSSIENALQGEVKYKRLEFWDGIVFDAIVKGKIVFNELFNDYYEVSIIFSVKEVKNDK